MLVLVGGCGWQGGRNYTDLPFAPGVLVHLLLIWPREKGAGAFQTRAVGGGGTVEQRADRDRGPAATSTIRPDFCLLGRCLAPLAYFRFQWVGDLPYSRPPEIEIATA